MEFSVLYGPFERHSLQYLIDFSSKEKLRLLDVELKYTWFNYRRT